MMNERSKLLTTVAIWVAFVIVVTQLPLIKSDNPVVALIALGIVALVALVSTIAIWESHKDTTATTRLPTEFAQREKLKRTEGIRFEQLVDALGEEEANSLMAELLVRLASKDDADLSSLEHLLAERQARQKR